MVCKPCALHLKMSGVHHLKVNFYMWVSYLPISFKESARSLHTIELQISFFVKEVKPNIMSNP